MLTNLDLAKSWSLAKKKLLASLDFDWLRHSQRKKLVALFLRVGKKRRLFLFFFLCLFSNGIGTARGGDDLPDVLFVAWPDDRGSSFESGCTIADDVVPIAVR